MGSYKYFLYSNDQYKQRESVEKNIGKIYTAGQVLVNGRWKNYTEISSNPANSFSDAKIVAEGDISDIKYTKAKSTWGGKNGR